MSAHYYHSVKHISRPAGAPHDAWDLFCAAATGHLPTIERLSGDEALLHYQIWYEFPLHFAVRANQAAAVRLLLDAGSNPAFSHFCYTSWQKLLPIAKERSSEVHGILVAEMQRRFNYDAAGEAQAVFSAIGKLGDVTKVADLLRSSPHLLEVADEHGNRPLHWAVMSRRLPIIELLLDMGADLQARRADLQTSLHLAMLGRDYWYHKANQRVESVTSQEVVDSLLSHGAEYEFSVAVARGDLQRVDECLGQDVLLAKRLNDSRYSPLGLAARFGQLDIVRLLLEHGADPDLPEECCPHNGAALFAACARNDVPMVKLLLQYGANPNGESDSSGSCLTIAEHRKNADTPEVHRLLTDAGAVDPLWKLADVEQIRDRIQNDRRLDADDCYWGGVLQRVVGMGDISLLHDFVARFGKPPIAEINPAHGWNIVADEGFLDELIRHGMDVNRPDWFGQTYLHACVVEEAEPQVAENYLARGADVKVVDLMHGKTALGVAIELGNRDMVKLLQAHGA